MSEEKAQKRQRNLSGAADTLPKGDLDEEMKEVEKTNSFLNYVKPYLEFNPENKVPKHEYTIELHRAKYTEEVCQLSLKYEAAIHKKADRDKKFV